ncbi:MAG: hypothetical protein AAF411_28540 [Myxococcota bacterium]
MKKDATARRLAATALAVATCALLLAAYAVSLGQQYLDDLRVLGEGMEASAPESPTSLQRPPLQLETE